MRRFLLAAAAAASVAVAATAAVAPGGVDPNLLKTVRALLDDGNAEDAMKFLDGGRDTFLGDLKSLAAVCFDAAWNASDLAGNKEPAAKLTAMLEEWSTAAAQASPDKAEAHRALGCARLASGRVQRLSGAADLKVDPWTGAADSFEKAYEVEPGNGSALAEASESVAEAAELPGADAAALLARAVALSSKAVEKHPDSLPVLKSASLLDLARARRALAAKDKAGAEAILEQGLARLAPRLKGTSPDLDLATAHNEIVAFVKSNPKDLKKPKGEFLTSTQRTATGLQVEVPVSRYWSLSRDEDSLYQFTPAFQALRTLYFDKYDWDTNYTLGDGTKVGGDNIKGIATNTFEINVRDLKSVKSKRAPAKTRLNGKLDEGFHYEIVGVDRDGDYSSERSWFFKSKAGFLTTYRVTIWDHREDALLDAVSRAVLDSVREPAKR